MSLRMRRWPSSGSATRRAGAKRRAGSQAVTSPLVGPVKEPVKCRVRGTRSSPFPSATKVICACSARRSVTTAFATGRPEGSWICTASVGATVSRSRRSLTWPSKSSLSRMEAGWNPFARTVTVAFLRATSGSLNPPSSSLLEAGDLSELPITLAVTNAPAMASPLLSRTNPLRGRELVSSRSPSAMSVPTQRGQLRCRVAWPGALTSSPLASPSAAGVPSALSSSQPSESATEKPLPALASAASAPERED